MKQLKIPILLMAFNRPDTTQKIFDEIRKAKPKNLFLSIDGPRNEKEKKKVDEVKKIVSKVNWPCKIKKRFNKENEGLLKTVSDAINWLFENFEKGIILEDDCLPDQSFFSFCEKMLEKYKDDERIMHISGDNFQRGWKRDNNSYYFSYYPHVWGWATWKRAWKKYDIKMKNYPELRKKKYLNDIFPSKLEKSYVKSMFDDGYYRNQNAADIRWMYSIIKNNGLSVIPNKNLVKNIGFGTDSTHTRPIDSHLSIPKEKMNFPLVHPKFIIRDRFSDERYIRWMFKNKLKKYILLKTKLHKLIKN